MISDATTALRLGNELTGKNLEDLLAKVTGTVGGIGIYSLAVGDKVDCTEQNFKVYERINENKIKAQSAVFVLEDHRVISVGSIARKTAEGKFHEKSEGMEFLQACQGAAEVARLLMGKTIEVIEIGSTLLPTFGGKIGETSPQKHYALRITDTKKGNSITDTRKGK
jgi:hypothetical protein